MSLEKFYELREDFIVLGLTGKMQAGADKVAEILSAPQLSVDNKEFLNAFPDHYKVISNSEAAKYRRIKDFYNYNTNWRQFNVIEYKSVVLLFILQQNYDKDRAEFANNITDWIYDLGTYKKFESPRFCSENGISVGSTDFIKGDFNEFLTILLNGLPDQYLNIFKTNSLSDDIKHFNFNLFFSESYQRFATEFFIKLDSFSVFLRHKLIHITSYCLRQFGTLDISVIEKDEKTEGLESIYIIAEVINSIIKCHRSNNGNKAHIIIDRLKNSYEMNYFREKYSGYYTLALNREEKSRVNSIESKISENPSITSHQLNIELINNLDDTEYLISEFKDGDFEGFDIENCVQKSDYHLWYNDELDSITFYDRFTKEDGKIIFDGKSINRTNEYYIYQPLLIQILKLTALIKQPGLITPSYIERMMQIAYNTKLNSGCISRQVGAVVTDKYFSVKGIGWNEVAHGQAPCSSRDIRDFEVAVNAKDRHSGFTDFELGLTDHKYKDGKKFQQKLLDDISDVKSNLEENLKGRPCSICFKTHHNNYEAKENQVHTRSLHAEENAMLQISKYGGQPLLGGNLFTTASTCELCAKKAYQLGIKNIFYIDVYPGISNDQILKNGTESPNVYAYLGAIGRGFNKLYEPFMSQKDENHIRTNFKAKVTQREQASHLHKILANKINSTELKEHLNDLKDDDAVIEKIVELMKKGLEK